MATEIAKAYVQIMPSAKGIKGELTKEMGGDLEAAGKSGGDKLGGSLVSTLKKVVVAAGIGKIVSDALSAGADIQQSFGGLDTIYGEAADAAKEYAYQAAQAGISANDYAEQAVSFGASLKQAFEGDTTKAVEAANTAIMDMTDNAAKMGTPIENIQSAYQGFAKQNYTMLDNLKLGYGGTKTEMERLLEDAQKISGVEYNIDNLGDVYDAIHVIQQDLGLTGVAAQEASTTFSGSFGAMKAAAENFLGALTTGGDVSGTLSTLITSALTFLEQNLIPMVMSIIQSIPDILTTAIPMLLEAGKGLFGALIDAVVTIGPDLWEAVKSLFSELGSLVSPDALSAGADAAMSLIDGILSDLPDMIASGGELLGGFLQAILSKLPEVLSRGTEIVGRLVSGVSQSLPQIIQVATQVIQSLLQTLLSNLPQILQGGVQMLMSIVQGIASNLPQIASSAVELIGTLISTIVQNLPQILQTGVELIGQLVVGLIQAIPQVVDAILTLITGIKDKFLEIDWAEIGLNIIEGIKNGLVNAAGKIAEAAKEAAGKALNAAKNFLGIKSPSTVFRDEVGAMMAEGIAIGFEDNLPTAEIEHSMRPLTDAAVQTASSPTYSYGGFQINVYGAPGQDITELADEIEYRINSKIQSMGAVYA